MKVTVVDTGVGNIPNAVRAFRRLGAEVALTARPVDVAAAACVVLPGVGAFPAAMERLQAAGLDGALRRAVADGAALLGICLGHQLLFEASDEFGEHAGLALLPGRVRALPEGVRSPHMGWSRLLLRRQDPLTAGLGPAPFMYFVHSFAARAGDGDVVAEVDAGGAVVCAAVRRGKVCGVQFHPEKSGAAGAALLTSFLELAA